jgi:hypothetical protein
MDQASQMKLLQPKEILGSKESQGTWRECIYWQLQQQREAGLMRTGDADEHLMKTG